MKIPSFLQKSIVKLILGKLGPETQKAITVVVSAAIAWLATRLPGVEQHLTPEVLTGLIWLVLDTVVTKLAAGPLKKYALELQEFLNNNGAKIDEDKFIGPVTVEAVKKKVGSKRLPSFRKG